MSAPVLFTLDADPSLAQGIAVELKVETGVLETRRFPDGETYIRVHGDLSGREAILLCTLDHPDTKAMAIMFAARTARELGARRVGLIAPYLAYMRQDRRFQDGEAVTSALFAAFLSDCVDWLVTLDPHLHRHPSLSMIYTIPTAVAQAAPDLAAWIVMEVRDPLVIGPDEESAQWAAEVARHANAPHMVLTKHRLGDRHVVIDAPDPRTLGNRTPVLVDDIISTAHTMAETVRHLRALGTAPPVCLAVHGIFAGGAEDALLQAGAGRIATTNSVTHTSNAVDISRVLAVAARSLIDVA